VLVDDIIGQQQVVIKRLGKELQFLSGYTGTAILGDGKPVLILELLELLKIYKPDFQSSKPAVVPPASGSTAAASSVHNKFHEEINGMSENENKVDSGEETLNRFLSFSLGSEEYAIPLLTVKEVMGMPEVTPIPQSPSFFLGS
jgi:hypothetical protein